MVEHPAHNGKNIGSNPIWLISSLLGEIGIRERFKIFSFIKGIGSIPVANKICEIEQLGKLVGLIIRRS